MPESLACLYFRVTGHVQGVGFRAATQATARRLKLVGWVSNRDDGSVELIACGRRTDLAALQRWLHKGPRYARVDDVQASPSKSERFDGFAIWR